jgi:hypothetical protein
MGAVAGLSENRAPIAHLPAFSSLSDSERQVFRLTVSPCVFPNGNSAQIGLHVDKFLRSRAITSGALPRRRVYFSPADDRSRGILRKVNPFVTLLFIA